MNTKPTLISLDPKMIRHDLGTQARAASNEETVAEYAEAMEHGKRFPAIDVFFDVEHELYILADGFHRLFAHLRARPNDPIEAKLHLGTVADAQWFSIGANQSHGLRRTNEDKRNAAEMAFLHHYGKSYSNRQIAEYVGVTHFLTNKIRKELESSGRLESDSTRIGKDGRVINVSNIGKKPSESNTCDKCWHYQSTRCTMDGQKHSSFDPACSDFSEIPLPEPETTVDEAEYSEEELRPYEPKEVSRRPARRKKGEYAEVALCVSNTDLAAIEIRNLLGETYLAALTQSGMKILKEHYET